MKETILPVIIDPDGNRTILSRALLDAGAEISIQQGRRGSLS